MFSIIKLGVYGHETRVHQAVKKDKSDRSCLGKSLVPKVYFSGADSVVLTPSLSGVKVS